MLKDKVALITGGSRGIGKAMVMRFLAEGAIVYFVSTRPSPFLSEMEQAASEAGTRVIGRQVDVTDEEGMKSLIKEIHGAEGKIDILVNNAGITRDGLVFRMKTEDWQKVLDINLTSAFLASREVSRLMIKQRSGAIINISSIVGVTGNAGQTNYAASKAGLIGFTKSLAKEVASRGVRANIIAPGFIKSDMTDALKDTVKDELKKQIPLGRIGEPEEIARTAVFLASDQSSYITGQTLLVDGGMGM